MLPLLNGLAAPDERQKSASQLAEYLGAEALLILLRDEETGRSRPAPGFAQTLPGGQTWRRFLDQCAQPGEVQCPVAFPNQHRTVAAQALTSQDGTTIVLMGDQPRTTVGELAAALPLIIRLLKTESAANTTQGYVSAAQEATRHATNLAKALDAARADVSAKAAELRQLNATLEQRVAEEIEERMKAEEALRQSQKMEAVGQLTGGVAHDFNNLLTVIRSSTDLLKRPGLPEERRQRYIGAISDTVSRAAKLTGQLLAFARRQTLQPVVFDVGSGVRVLTDMLGTLTGSRIKIVTDLPDAPCFVNADPSQFDTAIVNMAVNARDAMNGEGRLTITVHGVSTIPSVRAHPPVSGDFVAVCIEDTGSGISPEQMIRIFEPFFTTKDVGQGTGLGLSQVFGFAKQSGGDIRVQSELGKGTMFVLYLPRVDATAHEPTVEPEPLVDGHGTCVLVVEDNTEVGTFATQTLTELGYVTVWAANAQEALAELVKDAGRFDVVFSDVMMPGMNGIELAQEIRRRHHDLPVVLTSGYSHVLAQNGTYGFELLHKPYSVEQLSRILRKAATWQRRKRIIGR